MLLCALVAACGGERQRPAESPDGGQLQVPQGSGPGSGPASNDEPISSSPPDTGSGPAAGAAGVPGPPSCEREELLAPYRYSEVAFAARYGGQAKRFSEVPTTKERPLEACGLGTSLGELVRLTCDDGSNPFGGNRRAAHQSRRGNVGPGGQCGAIVDVYVVPCPEGTYDVHMDMYFCGPATAWQ